MSVIPVPTFLQVSNFKLHFLTPAPRPHHAPRDRGAAGKRSEALPTPTPRPARNRIKQGRDFSFGFLGKLGSMAARMRLAALRIQHRLFGHCSHFASSGTMSRQALTCVLCKYAFLAHPGPADLININGLCKIRRQGLETFKQCLTGPTLTSWRERETL